MVSYVHGKEGDDDAIVTETYDKTLHLKEGEPTLMPPGQVCPSAYDKDKQEDEK